MTLCYKYHYRMSYWQIWLSKFPISWFENCFLKRSLFLSIQTLKQNFLFMHSWTGLFMQLPRLSMQVFSICLKFQLIFHRVFVEYKIAFHQIRSESCRGEVIFCKHFLVFLVSGCTQLYFNYIFSMWFYP